MEIDETEPREGSSHRIPLRAIGDRTRVRANDGARGLEHERVCVSDVCSERWASGERSARSALSVTINYNPTDWSKS